MRSCLAKSYQKLLAEHPAYVKANYRLLSYGMNEESDTFRKSFPSGFKRIFFRVLKAVSDRKGPRLSY